MTRKFTHKEIMNRNRLSNKAATLTDALNDSIREAYKMNIAPDLNISVLSQSGGRPIISLWFFRDSDSIQNE